MEAPCVLAVPLQQQLPQPVQSHAALAPEPAGQQQLNDDGGEFDAADALSALSAVAAERPPMTG